MQTIRFGTSDIESSRLVDGCMRIASEVAATRALEIDYSREDGYRLLEARNGGRVP